MLGENFKIIRSLGQGATSEVFAAYNQKADKNVALKVFSSLVLNDADALRRLQSEADTLAQLRHPNVVALLNQLRTDSFFGLELELVEGSDLRTWNKNYDLPLIEPKFWVLAQI